MSKSICSKAPTFRRTEQLCGHPRRAEKPVIGTGMIRVVGAAEKKEESSSEKHSISQACNEVLEQTKLPSKPPTGNGVGKQMK